MGQITPIQIRKIHAIAKRLGWSDEQYREYLMTEGDGFVRSCKDLSEDEAERIIRKMELQAAKNGVWNLTPRPSSKGDGRRKYDDLAGRKGMASPKQLRMIEAMWKDVSRYEDEELRQKALRKFLYRIVGVENLRFLAGWQVRKVVNAIGNMRV